MPGTVLPNLGLTGDIPDHESWGDEGRANDRRLDALVMAGIKGIASSDPASPVDGDRYLVGAGATGLFHAKDGYIAAWNANLGVWVYYPPQAGWSLYDNSSRVPRRYGSSWFVESLLVDVRAFGAVGDGVADDTAAVVAALAAAPAGSRVFFAAGTYNLAAWSVTGLSKKLWLCGEGAGRSILKGASGASFLSITADFRCSDLTFDTWSTVLDFSAVSSVLDDIRIEDVEITNYAKAIYGNSATAAVGVRGVRISGCQITTGTSYAIFLSLAIMEEIHVLDNVIKDCVQRAIDLGGNSLVFADDRGAYVVSGNLIDGVTNVGGTAIAVICYGWRATITRNVVRNVSRDVPTASDCDGIYTKCRYTVIANNVLVDAGQAEGFINVKGGARNETVSQPYGFSVIVANNMLVDTQVAPTLAGGGKQTHGIKIATSDVLVVDNMLQGITNVGIYTDSDTGSDAPCHNIVIARNSIKDHRGKAAIAVYGRGDRIRVLDNLIDGVLGSFDTSVQNFGLDLSKKEGTGFDVIGNRVSGLVDTGHTPVAISLSPSHPSFTVTANPATNVLTTPSAHAFSLNDPVIFTNLGGALPAGISAATTYYVKAMPTGSTFTISTTPGGSELDITDAGTGTHTVHKVVTFTSWRVLDNHVEDARYGIQFSWDQTYVAVDDVLVRHTTGRNINATTPPASADLVKYSDTPTSLVNLPAQAETVARVSATVAEIKNGTNNQDLKIYGTDDGAGNYERVSLRMDASHATIDVEKGGTGTQRSLEIRMNGTRVGVISTSGSWQPNTTASNQDIGATGNRWRWAYLEKGIDVTGGAYNTGHIVLGTYHIWVEAATGFLRIKNGAPTSDSDGAIVGGQA